MQGSNSVKPNQVGILIFITQTGIGITMLSSELAEKVGHDGWLSILITGPAAIIISMLILFLLRRYQDKAIYDINQLLYGKLLGICFNVILVLYLLAAAIVGLSIFNFFIRITLLHKTPPWVLSFLISLPSFFLVWQGLKSMARFLYISLVNNVIIIGLVFLLFKDVRLSFLAPVGEAGLGRILQGTETVFFSFIGFELIAFIYPYITDRNKTGKFIIGANLASMIFFLGYVLTSTTIFGENYLKDLSMPFFNLARVYHAPVVERLDLYVIALWYIPMACSVRSYTFAAFDGIQKIFHLKKSKVLFVTYFLAIGLLSSLTGDFDDVLMLIGILNYIGMGVTAFLIFCLVLSFLRKKGVHEK